MLRKRTRSHQKDQQNMGQSQHLVHDSSSNEPSCYANCDAFLKQKHKTNSLFTVPGLFVGLNPKTSESDSVRSPTSPLDFKVFSKPNLGNSSFGSSKSPNESTTQKSWDCNKVGLSIIESLDDETKPSFGKILRSSDSKSILFAPRIRVLKNPSLNVFSNSLPKNYAIKQSNPQMISPSGQESSAKFWSHSLDSTNSGSKSSNLSCMNPGKDLVASFSASEIELSEDYTCVRKHGPNPKTTHIFGDCILERHEDEFIAKSFNFEQLKAETVASEVPTLYVFDDFLSFCYSCKKKLEGEDIYMYRGEKAFCSWDCRSREISIEEEMEKSNSKGNSSTGTKILSKPNSCEELLQTSMFIAA